jgi:hypothetical protein
LVGRGKERRLVAGLDALKDARLAEIARFDHGYERDFAARVKDQSEAIEREARRPLGRSMTLRSDAPSMNSMAQ